MEGGIVRILARTIENNCRENEDWGSRDEPRERQASRGFPSGLSDVKIGENV